MSKNEKKYISKLKQMVYNQISADICKNTIDEIVNTDLKKSHLDDKASKSFQDYYFTILDNEELYFSSTNFFSQFKKQYALQGIDNDSLNKFEKEKEDILRKIREDDLATLYFEKFYKVAVKDGAGFKKKNLGSFFTKLVHTFRPDEYCALDNPIKNYFGLSQESFFISFLIISSEYKKWATDNNELHNIIKEKLQQADNQGIMKFDKLTDLKLLDLIFWSKANRK